MTRGVHLRLAVAAFGVLAAFGLGCTGPTPPDPSDPGAGKELLRTALDAWKRGETHEGFQQSNSSLTVVEPAWKAGTKLIDYEIEAEHETSGYDVRFKVTLHQKDPNGPPKKQNAIYNVCTTPAHVVKRAEGSWGARKTKETE